MYLFVAIAMILIINLYNRSSEGKKVQLASKNHCEQVGEKEDAQQVAIQRAQEVRSWCWTDEARCETDAQHQEGLWRAGTAAGRAPEHLLARLRRGAGLPPRGLRGAHVLQPRGTRRARAGYVRHAKRGGERRARIGDAFMRKIGCRRRIG